MIGPEACRVMDLRRSLAALALAMTAACVGGVNRADCAIDSDCGANGFCFAGSCIAGTRTCPVLQPTFSSLNRGLIQPGCGVGQRNCHATDSAAVDSGPSFAGHPWAALVNAPAANRLGSARGLVLVKPADPANSFLMIKLRLMTTSDPSFGPGQPANAPGSICAPTLSVIEDWIRRGAPDN